MRSATSTSRTVVAGERNGHEEGTSATAKFSLLRRPLTITVTTKDVGEKTYARFEASYEEAARAPPDDAARRDGAEEGRSGGSHESRGMPRRNPTACRPRKSRSRSPPREIQKEVDELNARLSKWVYQIPSYNKSSFEKKKSELLKDKATSACSDSRRERHGGRPRRLRNRRRRIRRPGGESPPATLRRTRPRSLRNDRG